MNEEDLRDCFAMFAMNGLLNGYQKPDEFTGTIKAIGNIIEDKWLDIEKFWEEK